jgi:hypothetical protein
VTCWQVWVHRPCVRQLRSRFPRGRRSRPLRP